MLLSFNRRVAVSLVSLAVLLFDKALAKLPLIVPTSTQCSCCRPLHLSLLTVPMPYLAAAVPMSAV